MSEPATALPLETGWLPTTPIGDSYLRRFLWNWADACAATAQAFGGHVLDTDAMRLADSGLPVAFSNCATLTQPLTAENAAETLAQIGTFYAFNDAVRSGEVLLVSAWPTGDLRPFGWNLMGHPPIHLLPQGIPARTPPPELRIVRVASPELLHVWEQTISRGYPLEGLEDAPAGTLAAPSLLDDPRYGAWVGFVEGRPVAAASAWAAHGVVNVTLVATLPEERRKGYGEALTWVASRLDPALPAMLLSSDDGRPVYERMGYLPLQRVTLWFQGRTRAGA
jgi:GNAT superfamily N-acetyltransferase